MADRREQLIDSLAGAGRLESASLPALPVRYTLQVYRQRIDENPGLLIFRGTVAADPSALFPFRGGCDLILADGIRVPVFLKWVSAVSPVVVRNAGELALRYPD